MIGPPLQLGITHLPMAMLIATPIAVSVTGAGIVAVVLWLLAVLLLNMHLNMRALWEPEKYQLESLAASHYVEVCTAARWVDPCLMLSFGKCQTSK
jgi:Na+-transporting methylmalonyl-CoA/oxaloacetate decarboxylase gamma subunit